RSTRSSASSRSSCHRRRPNRASRVPDPPVSRGPDEVLLLRGLQGRGGVRRARPGAALQDPDPRAGAAAARQAGADAAQVRGLKSRFAVDLDLRRTPPSLRRGPACGVRLGTPILQAHKDWEETMRGTKAAIAAALLAGLLAAPAFAQNGAVKIGV